MGSIKMFRLSVAVCVIGAVVGTPAIKFGGRKDVVAVVGPNTVRRTYTGEFEPDYFEDFDYEYDQEAICPEGSWANGYRQKTDLGCAGGGECSAQLLSQPAQGDFADDAGAEGVNVGCTDGNNLIGYGEVRHTNGDNWSEFRTCPVGSVVCGVSSAGQWVMVDNVAITKLKFFCCNGQPTA